MYNFFRPSKMISDVETKVEEKISSLQTLAEGEPDKGIPMEIDRQFPESFKEQIKDLAIGDVSWEAFFTAPKDGVYAVKGRMQNGSAIQRHWYNNADAYIYLVDGRLINWMEGAHDGDVIVPAEEVHEAVQLLNHEVNVDGWYKIGQGKTHWMQAIADSHFVLKFCVNNQ